MRKAFSMVMAIFVILILATVAMVVLNMTSSTVQNTTMQYRQEQAALYAKSYTELAIMAVTDYNRTANVNCVETINSNIPNLASYNDGSGYQTTVNIYYIGNNLPCTAARVLNGATVIPTVPAGSAPYVIIDTDVRYIDTSTSLNPIVYHKRTLQKI